MSSIIRAETVIGLLFVAAAAAIATAWGFQLIGGYVPCKLCLAQRVPYYIGLPLTALALILCWRGMNIAALICLVIVAGVFTYGSGLGVYQAGAEWDFWAGPNDCGGGSGVTTDAANMLKSLQSVRIVSCTEASWRMFGLSFAGWNAVASAACVVLALAGAVLCIRPKSPA